jgi:hypothetical protein
MVEEAFNLGEVGRIIEKQLLGVNLQVVVEIVLLLFNDVLGLLDESFVVQDLRPAGPLVDDCEVLDAEEPQLESSDDPLLVS